MSTNSVGPVNCAGTFSLAPPIIIAAEKNPTIRTALEAADKNSNGLIDNSGELQAAVESLQKTLSDTEFEHFVSQVVARTKIEETAPAPRSFEAITLSPQKMNLPYSFYDLAGKNIYTVTEPFKNYDVTKGIAWKFDRNLLTAEGRGNVTGKKPSAFFISAPLNTKGANNLVVTVVKMSGKFPLDGTGSGMEINFPWSDSPDKLTLPWLPKFADHKWKETPDSEVVRVTNLKAGDRLEHPLGGRKNIKIFVNVLLDKGESITIKVELE